MSLLFETLPHAETVSAMPALALRELVPMRLRALRDLGSTAWNLIYPRKLLAKPFRRFPACWIDGHEPDSGGSRHEDRQGGAQQRLELRLDMTFAELGEREGDFALSKTEPVQHRDQFGVDVG